MLDCLQEALPTACSKTCETVHTLLLFLERSMMGMWKWINFLFYFRTVVLQCIYILFWMFQYIKCRLAEFVQGTGFILIKWMFDLGRLDFEKTMESCSFWKMKHPVQTIHHQKRQLKEHLWLLAKLKKEREGKKNPNPILSTVSRWVSWVFFWRQAFRGMGHMWVPLFSLKNSLGLPQTLGLWRVTVGELKPSLPISHSK